MIQVYSDSVREVGTADPGGARSFVIGERSSLVFEGDAPGAVDTLRAIGAGASVCVRHPGGLRSCMNKPALWEWVASLST